MDYRDFFSDPALTRLREELGKSEKEHEQAVEERQAIEKAIREALEKLIEGRNIEVDDHVVFELDRFTEWLPEKLDKQKERIEVARSPKEKVERFLKALVKVKNAFDELENDPITNSELFNVVLGEQHSCLADEYLSELLEENDRKNGDNPYSLDERLADLFGPGASFEDAERVVESRTLGPAWVKSDKIIQRIPQDLCQIGFYVAGIDLDNLKRVGRRPNMAVDWYVGSIIHLIQFSYRGAVSINSSISSRFHSFVVDMLVKIAGVPMSDEQIRNIIKEQLIGMKK